VPTANLITGDDANVKGVECLMQMAMPIKIWSYVLFVLVHIGTSSASAANAGCQQSGAEIATDRPDVTNSSLVVPTGSLQNESGVDLTSKDGARILDGTNNRLRLGIAPCLEVLVDLPTYFATVRGRASSGFSDVAPAVKWQISPVPGVLDLSITAGVGLPTGTTAVAGPGVQPYLQFPWSRELGDGWGISGMLTSFFVPADPTSQFSQQVTFAIEKKIGDRSDLFVEYVGGYAAHGGASQVFNTGGAYHLTPTQQIDFHLAVGLNRNAPTWIFGIGYSFRLDGLFAGTATRWD
jgi:Putative MetA-pathway of phenol degradation